MFGKKKPQVQVNAQGQKQEAKPAPQQAGAPKQRVPAAISLCESIVKQQFNNSFDIVIQTIETNAEKAMIVYVDGLINKDLLDRDILQPLKANTFSGNLDLALRAGFKVLDDLSTYVQDVLGGNVAVFYEGSEKIYIIEFRDWQMRSVDEPTAETIIRGPKEGFTENIRTNTSLVRRKIRNPNLVIEHLTFGKQTNTYVELVYVKGIVNQDVLNEVRKRLNGIDVDQVLDSGIIEQYISDYTLLPVNGIGVTQRPDKLAFGILEGRVGILCDGTPHALVIPELFMENFQTPEDYYSRPIQAFILRALRFMGLALTVALPGTAVAILTYNREMVPGEFLSGVIQSMLNTPMSTSAEVLLMIMMFELLREAGVRLPHAVGSAISIVGSLIIGQAAVDAKLVSQVSVIIVAISAVSGFVVSNLQEFTLVYRLFFWLLGSIMGLLGIGAASMIMMTQLMSTQSFGIPIMSSFSKEETKDSIPRFPLRNLIYRPISIAKANRMRRKRQGNSNV